MKDTKNKELLVVRCSNQDKLLIRSLVKRLNANTPWYQKHTQSSIIISALEVMCLLFDDVNRDNLDNMTIKQMRDKRYEKLFVECLKFIKDSNRFQHYIRDLERISTEYIYWNHEIAEE